MYCFLILSKKNKGTFRPLKKVKQQHRCYKLMEISQATLGSMNMRDAVKLPAGENLNEWLAVSVVDFFNELSCLIPPVLEFCTNESCPEMAAGPQYKYAWQDDKNVKPVIIPACEYISNVMEWVDCLLNNEKIFPSDCSAPFPKDFKKIVKNIFKRLFRIYAHIYHHHRDGIVELGVEEALNSSFRHFIYYTQEFDLIPEDQLAPLKTIIDMLTK
ncbi:MOB kinase activator 1B [Tritrichomonas foetus]|uniref:MOB kinase activator 1B n=1 Tax=Tritrichomonas foetus TaxID=1144522 RepID=A0A1J4JTG6_9EUKA|nr:MOB kinase activator 1B [Tritrichomonas foetus]|eukprot:OHT00565.1 MOB kinase activator 1B [Tritrichomonas foetus]